jgi:hypothetical protein
MTTATKTKQIKTFEQACKKLGLDPKTAIPDMSAAQPKHHAALIATAKLHIIAEALNDGWIPDWSNYSEYKYFPYFEMGGFRFDVSALWFVGAHSSGGSRLCYRTRALSDYAAKTFIELYRDMMVIGK